MLHRFPLEAGVPFDFEVIEEADRAQMMQEARERVLAGRYHREQIAPLLDALFARASDAQIEEALDRLLSEGAKLKTLLAFKDGAIGNLARFLNIDPQLSENTVADQVINKAILPQSEYHAVGQHLRHQNLAKTIADGLMDVDPNRPNVDQAFSALLTQKGTPKRVWRASPRKTRPWRHKLRMKRTDWPNFLNNSNWRGCWTIQNCCSRSPKRDGGL